MIKLLSKNKVLTISKWDKLSFRILLIPLNSGKKSVLRHFLSSVQWNKLLPKEIILPTAYWDKTTVRGYSSHLFTIGKYRYWPFL